VLHIGTEFGVMLNDPQLRNGLIAEAERSEQSAQKLRASLRLRFGLAHVLRALAVRLEPRVPHVSETAPSRPVFAE
jgi:hypothetical protein